MTDMDYGSDSAWHLFRGARTGMQQPCKAYHAKTKELREQKTKGFASLHGPFASGVGPNWFGHIPSRPNARQRNAINNVNDRDGGLS